MAEIDHYNPGIIKTEVFATVPDKYRRKGTHPGKRTTFYMRQTEGIDFYLEGPSFDRDGNLFFTDIPHGRIFRMEPGGRIDLFAQYDGEPNGLKIHKDGRIFIADFKHGLMVLDPKTAAVEPFLDFRPAESFKGVNDLIFASNGDLYFTDQGKTGLHDPTGRVYRYSERRGLESLIDTLPGPNGITLDPAETVVLVGNRSNTIWWLPLNEERPQSRAAVFCFLPGFGTPDGQAMDEAGNLIVCQSRMGIARMFDNKGLPIYDIHSCITPKMSNLAFGVTGNRKQLYIVEGSGAVLIAEMPVPGLTLYSHL
ncbi:MAG: SMP-30/gluconolactonase/LRE family protein [Rhodospirillales bacterium]